MGPKGEAPVGDLDDESAEAEAVCRHCFTDFHRRNNQNLKMSAQFTS